MATKRTKLLMGSAFVLGFMCVSSLHAASSMDGANTLLTKIVSAAKSPGVAAKLCKKAPAVQGQISVRSFEGMLCSNVMVAAFAEKVCYNASTDYEGSHCHKNAMSVLGSKTPDQAMQEIIDKGSAPGANNVIKAQVAIARTIKSMNMQ